MNPPPGHCGDQLRCVTYKSACSSLKILFAAKAVDTVIKNLKTFCHHFPTVWIRTEQVYNSVCALYLNINIVFYMSVDDNVIKKNKNKNKPYPFF